MYKPKPGDLVCLAECIFQVIIIWETEKVCSLFCSWTLFDFQIRQFTVHSPWSVHVRRKPTV